MARSVMEGVAMSLRESLEIIKQLGVPVKEIRVSGGGAKSALWKQIMADVMNQAACTMNAEQGPAFALPYWPPPVVESSRISKKLAKPRSK